MKEVSSPLAVPFHSITTGKLRRYFSWQNFIDIFRCIIGVLQSFYYLWRIKPEVVFSKGGYVSVPVCMAAWVLRIRVVTHESDLTPGLANKINMKFATKILYSFAQTQKYLPQNSVQVTLPIRKELLNGSQQKAQEICGFDTADERPVILVMGGSLGSVHLNTVVRESLDMILQKFRVIHLTGKGKRVSFEKPGSYFQQEFAQSELSDFVELASLVVSRAGANSLFEYLSLAKPMVLVPLVKGSRGDQIDNAKCFAEKGWAIALDEETMNPQDLQEAIERVSLDVAMKQKLESEQQKRQATEFEILDILESC